LREGLVVPLEGQGPAPVGPVLHPHRLPRLRGGGAPGSGPAPGCWSSRRPTGRTRRPAGPGPPTPRVEIQDAPGSAKSVLRKSQHRCCQVIASAGATARPCCHRGSSPTRRVAFRREDGGGRRGSPACRSGRASSRSSATRWRDQLESPAHFGTTTGQLWIGREGARSGAACSTAPPIHCVKVAVV
jgi:hypothetical protein